MVFVWEALQDMTLILLGVCAFVSLPVGIVMVGWPKVAHDGIGIVASILLVVLILQQVIIVNLYSSMIWTRKKRGLLFKLREMDLGRKCQ